jgi:hypothetical protein
MARLSHLDIKGPHPSRGLRAIHFLPQAGEAGVKDRLRLAARLIKQWRNRNNGQGSQYVLFYTCKPDLAAGRIFQSDA